MLYTSRLSIWALKILYLLGFWRSSKTWLADAPILMKVLEIKKFEMSIWFDRLSKNSISLSFVRSFVANQAYIVKPFSLKMRLSTSSLILKSMFSLSGVRNSQIGVRILGDNDFMIGRPGISASESISFKFEGMINLYSSSCFSMTGDFGISLINQDGVLGLKRSFSKNTVGDFDFDTESSSQ